MEIELDCPWCAQEMRVAREDLDDQLRCGDCGMRFAFAADDARGALSAAA